MSEQDERARVMSVAREWLGTPYHDCSRIKGVGVDCACLLAAVWEEAELVAHVDVPAYSPQWFLHRDEPVLLDILLAHAVEIEQAAAQSADVVVYKFGRQFSHAAIITEPGWPAIIHAYKQARCVTLGEGLGGDLEERERKFYRFKGWAL